MKWKQRTRVLNEPLEMVHRRSRYFLFLYCKLRLRVDVLYFSWQEATIFFFFAAAVVSRTTATRVSVNDFLWRGRIFRVLFVFLFVWFWPYWNNNNNNNKGNSFAIMSNCVLLCTKKKEKKKKPQMRNRERKRSGRLWKICGIIQSKSNKLAHWVLFERNIIPAGRPGFSKKALQH